MHAIKRIFIYVLFQQLLFAPVLARAYDEQWGIFQVRQKLAGGGQVLAEFVRRDTSDLFSKRFLDLYRVSYGTKLHEDWTLLVGGAFVDFESGGDERRLHQFLVYNGSLSSSIGVLARIGLEQRQFNNDSKWYWRSRNRVQINFFQGQAVGVALYDEIFFVPDGGTRLATGLSENRFGIGPRFNAGAFEAYLYHVVANWRTLRRDDRLEWLQLQMIYSFD